MGPFFILISGGFLAGTLGGLLGIGGGILIMPVLRFFVGLSPVYAAGTCIAPVFFTTLGGSIRHYKLGHIKIKSLIPVIIPGALSTIVFSILFSHFTGKATWLDLGTGLVFSLISIRMIIDGSLDFLGKKVEQAAKTEMRGQLVEKITIGGLAGILPGFFGIGTGAVLVPAFTLVLKSPIKIAIGSSLACFSVNAFLSAAMKLQQGFVNTDVILPLCLGTFIGSYIGAKLNKRFPSPLLKVMFGVLFIYIALKYFLLFSGR
ncbi:MAG: sulfite exporter TauE/SafE family protein [Candidatus Krumholzibacteria bacterium]|nr:sulfite exporter TauE/SafE family protein [Candidatus Krumholzibacteria bacterium]